MMFSTKWALALVSLGVLLVASGLILSFSATTAFRLIGLQQLPKQFWTKLDFKVPVDWENDNEIPASGELELGKMFTSIFGAYLNGLVGIGSDKHFDWGAGLNVRFVY